MTAITISKIIYIKSNESVITDEDINILTEKQRNISNILSEYLINHGLTKIAIKGLSYSVKNGLIVCGVNFAKCIYNHITPAKFAQILSKFEEMLSILQQVTKKSLID